MFEARIVETLLCGWGCARLADVNPPGSGDWAGLGGTGKASGRGGSERAGRFDGSAIQADSRRMWNRSQRIVPWSVAVCARRSQWDACLGTVSCRRQDLGVSPMRCSRSPQTRGERERPGATTGARESACALRPASSVRSGDECRVGVGGCDRPGSTGCRRRGTGVRHALGHANSAGDRRCRKGQHEEEPSWSTRGCDGLCRCCHDELAFACVDDALLRWPCALPRHRDDG